MINAAIVGLGWWGKNLASAIQGKSSEIRFTTGVTQELAETQAYAAQNGLTLTDRFEDVLADPAIQAVVLATPHTLHASQIVAAAEAGKHVFCEKPLSLNAADARRAIAACESRKLVLGVGQNKRFWPSMSNLRQVVASGVLGQLLHLEGHYSNQNSSNFFSEWRDSPVESPAGGLTGTGIHIIDAFVAMAGPAAEVSAQVNSLRSGKDPRDATSVVVRFASGIGGYFAMVRATPFYWRVHVFGDEASAEAVSETELVIRHRGGRIERHVYPLVDSLKAELETFAKAIPTPARAATPYPISTAEMFNTIALFEAVVSSIGSQQAVQVAA
ncbi:MAG: Gfo/Idh/MocA family oxidoreductase [Pseudomonadota bacterium]